MEFACQSSAVRHQIWPLHPPHDISVSVFFNDTATTEIYPLSLHDALPISRPSAPSRRRGAKPEPPHLCPLPLRGRGEGEGVVSARTLLSLSSVPPGKRRGPAPSSPAPWPPPPGQCGPSATSPTRRTHASARGRRRARS